jgi:hypothetical protein
MLWCNSVWHLWAADLWHWRGLPESSGPTTWEIKCLINITVLVFWLYDDNKKARSFQVFIKATADCGLPDWHQVVLLTGHQSFGEKCCHHPLILKMKTACSSEFLMSIYKIMWHQDHN